MDHSYDLLKIYPWVREKKIGDKVYQVNSSIFKQKLEKEKEKLIKDLSERYSSIIVSYTDINDEMIELFEIVENKDGYFFSGLKKNQVKDFLGTIYVGGWALFFSNDPLGKVKIDSDIYDSSEFSKICMNAHVDIAISSYLDDVEWLIFIK